MLWSLRLLLVVLLSLLVSYSFAFSPTITAGVRLPRFGSSTFQNSIHHRGLLMSSQSPPDPSLNDSAVGKKRPRPDDPPRVSSTESLGLTGMSLEQQQQPAIPNDPIQKLRLEAIFHPKFENEKSSKDIRQEMTQLVKDQKGYLEVTLKHSGSLVLWSGGQRFYSKNSLSNQFTLVAEVLLRQHFERAWRTTSDQDGKSKYEECSRVLEESRLTCAFEVVTSVLGDHGDIPNRDFLILTAVAERSTERFYTTAQVLEFAQRYRLPHNDAWAFTNPSSCEALFRLYDESRETGLASDTVAALSKAAQTHVASMYPHVEFQGDILEGFIIRYIPYGQQSEDSRKVEERLQVVASVAQEILNQVPPSLPSSFELNDSTDLAVNKANIRAIFEELEGPQLGTGVAETFARRLDEILHSSDGGTRRRVHRVSSGSMGIDLPGLTRDLVSVDDRETKRIAQLLQTMSELNKVVTYSLVREHLHPRSPRTLSIIHVMQDQTFFQYQKSKSPGDMNLFRGFCVEVGNHDDTSLNDGVDPIECDESHDDGPFLMLKMKFLPYMVRTFICRNQLNLLKQDSPDAFVRAARQLMDRWGISGEGKAKWLPFLEKWAIFAKGRLEQTADDMPPLSSFSYLRHLELFSEIYNKGQAVAMEEESPNAFRGFVCCVAPTVESSERAAKALANVLECRQVVALGEAAHRWTMQGVVCFGKVDDLLADNRDLLDNVVQYSVIVMYGCADWEIETALKEEPTKKVKEYKGRKRGWEKQSCYAKCDLPMSSVPEDGPPTSEEFQHLVSKIKEASTNARDIRDQDTRSGVLIFFPGIPGCGKSSVLESIGGELQKRLAGRCKDGRARNVSLLAGDIIGKQFWPRLKSDRRKDIPCVTISDKNTPPPSWASVGDTCSATSAFPLAVFPDKSALKTTRILGSRKPDGSYDPDKSHFYPFSLEYLAICMARVLRRKPGSHVGKLDSGTPLAAMIVIMFYSFYRYRSAEEFREDIDGKLKSSGTLDSLDPVELPFMAEDGFEIPEDVKATLTEALQLQIGYDNTKAKVKIGDLTVKDMEERLRKSIAEAEAEILAMSASLEASKEAFMDQVVQRVVSLDATSQGDDIAPGVDSKPKIKLASIDVGRALVHRVIKEQTQTGNISQFLQMALEGQSEETRWQDDHYVGEFFVEQTHVTMLFWMETTQESIWQIYSPLIGAEVGMQATALLWGDGVAALEVSIADTTGDGKKVPECGNDFSHITVWVAEGTEARMSNRLPKLVEDGIAQRVEFTRPVPLSGTVSFWDFENKPLPIEC